MKSRPLNRSINHLKEFIEIVEQVVSEPEPREPVVGKKMIDLSFMDPAVRYVVLTSVYQV